jgi:hypothetical protein
MKIAASLMRHHGNTASETQSAGLRDSRGTEAINVAYIAGTYHKNTIEHKANRKERPDFEGVP